MGKRERMEKRRVRKLESETSTNNTSKSRRGGPSPESDEPKIDTLSQNVGCPYLPTEMWDNILTNVNDLHQLWTVYHKVSPHLRKSVEDRVSKHFLCSIYVLFKDGLTALVFDRLGPGTQTNLAYFKPVGISHMCPRPGRTSNWTLEGWQNRIRLSDTSTEYVIIIDRHGDGSEALIHDTALPDLSFNLGIEEKKEVSVDWRALLHAFFREQKGIDVRLKALTNKFVGRAQEEFYDQHFKNLRNRRSVNPHEVKFRKELRCERLRQKYAKDKSKLKAVITLGFSHPFQTKGACHVHNCIHCDAPSYWDRFWRWEGSDIKERDKESRFFLHDLLEDDIRVAGWIFELRKDMNKGNCLSKRYFKSTLDKLRELHNK